MKKKSYRYKNLVYIYSPYKYDPLSAKDETTSASKYQKIVELKNKEIENKVNNLSLDNIRKIYTGEITNWKNVDGDDASIIAYQRPVNSGSQTEILSLVMNGLKMKEPTKEEYIESIAGITDAVANYDNIKDSIGYLYYYYATTMYANDKLKFLSVDNVKPSYDTIKNGTYPLITSYYIVTLKTSTSKTVGALKNTMLSDKGQSVAKEAGYIEHGKK